MRLPFTKGLIVAGIGTEIGKTVTAAVLVEAYQADYWKPIQSGAWEDSDTQTVRQLVSNRASQFWPETYRLRQPLSPHAAAEADGVQIELSRIQPPQTPNRLIVELAGGLMVPLNATNLNVDLIRQLGFPVVLVSRNYLGSINHTLLSVAVLRNLNIPLIGLIFNGPTVASSEEFILHYTQLPLLGRIGQEPQLTPDVIQHYAQQFA